MKTLLAYRWFPAVLYGLAHFAAAVISQFLSLRRDGFVPFWLASGLYVGILLLVETKRWPEFILAAAAANLAFDLTQGQPVLVALIFGAGNCAEAVACAGMMRRFVAHRPTLATLHEVVSLALFATVSCALSATLGAAASFWLLGHTMFAVTWSNWWSGDILGILLVTPLLLGERQEERRAPSPSSIGITEQAAFVVCLIATTGIVFFMEPDLLFPRNSLLVLFVLWSGLRLGSRVTSLTVLGISLVAVFSTSSAMGSNLGSVAISITQTFLVTLALSGLIPAAILNEHRRAEEALQEAQAELARISRLTVMGELAASIAHEISQPLATVVVNAEAAGRLLAQERPNLPEVRDAISDIAEAGLRAGAVISRIRALLAKETPPKTALPIGEVIHETLAFARAEIDKQHVTTEEEAASCLRVIGDRVQLQQVILNLILNGTEGMAPLGQGPKVLRITAEAHSAGSIVVAVKDTGIGLAPENTERVFDPFYTTKPHGLGMGLCISRSIIEAHGGRLWATPNEDGRGATFRFTLPLAP
jgi:signal transduction histidine kinase